MATNGGLKLRLQPATSKDRRHRYAHVAVTSANGGEARTLVTDADGCMNHHLDDGDYRLAVLGGLSASFRVSEHRWTTVRLALG